MSDLPAAERFNLVAGPNWTANYEPNESPPVDGTKRELRDPTTGSPFTISVVPPDTLTRAMSGNGVSAPRSVFDPLLERANEAAINAGQDPSGTRVRANTNVGIIDASLRANNNFKALKNQQQNYQRNQVVSRVRGERETIPMIAGNGRDFTDRTARRSQANQVAVSDLDQALSVMSQARQIQQVPPLTLLVNPQSLNLIFSKKQAYQDRNRFNYIFQSTFEEQVRMSVAGRTGAFIAGGNFADAQNQRTLTPSGYQYANKQDSASWQNLMSLFSIYRNNAVIYNPDGSEAHLWIGNVVIEYDQVSYFGQFENFNYSYDEMKQHGSIDFTFDFTVSFMFDQAQFNSVLPYPAPSPSPSDPRYLGRPSLQAPVLGSSFRLNQARIQEDDVENVAVFNPFLI